MQLSELGSGDGAPCSVPEVPREANLAEQKQAATQGMRFRIFGIHTLGLHEFDAGRRAHVSVSQNAMRTRAPHVYDRAGV